jgi:predicted acyltransferase
MSATLPPLAPPPPAADPSPAVAARGAAPARERLLSLDVFRGMTVAGMLLVNDPGTWSAIYPPLEHAEWHGWTPTDLVFPFFLFIVGITTVLSLGARRAAGADDAAIRRQVLRRGALIFLFGLVLNWFPFFQWGEIKGLVDPSFLDRVAYRVEHLRVMGVLQRIGLAYLAAGLITLRTTWRQQLAVAAVLLVGYWAVMALAAVPPTGRPGWQVWDTPGTTVDAWLDRVLLTPDHLWVGGGGLRDPEGLLSTLPAIGSVLLGAVCGRWIAERGRPLVERLAGMFAVGALAMAAGLVWHWVFPINKSLWTSSYTLFTAGIASVTLATVMWVVDVYGVRGWTRPFVVYGVNPMLAFLGSGLVARLIYSVLRVNVGGTEVPLQKAIFDAAFASWLSPRNASLAFALAFVAFFYAILDWCYRRGIVLKV